MKKPLFTAVAAACLIAVSAAPAPAVTFRAPLTLAASGQGIAGQYIVTLKPGVSIVATVSEHGIKTMYRYGRVLNGFAAKLDSRKLAKLRGAPGVVRIEQDAVVRADGTQQNPPSWGLDRIDQTALPLSHSFTYNATGAGVYAYIIDTGIYAAHPQFGGRASNVYDALGGNGADCNGHGTHVAGTVGSTSYGVAKSVYLRGVRVLNCQGSGTSSGVIAGMNWVAGHRSRPAVANMSLGGGFSSSMNSAADNLASSGVFLAVAAGNDGRNACDYSPGSAANTTTVAASTIRDARASYSNYGACVDLYAPGSSITSTWLNGGTNTISGTSMATPHVTGVAALYKAANGDASFGTVRNWLVSNAVSGVISGNPAGTPNRLLDKRGL
ncbi:S8 family peptidase [Actinomadura luteofluorescens]|uniref:Subtilisin family serine protease n=1 Tax=Actinomadura luteofluorescens TaxID=46163 RepID=A0A7Y9JEH2_9ACTN|nr:S8 family peptidase [Actinomadura luteofluorescens]NYD45940.1 subtilisin family serine protease [Actinomadura luteofluorescens]